MENRQDKWKIDEGSNQEKMGLERKLEGGMAKFENDLEKRRPAQENEKSEES